MENIEKAKQVIEYRIVKEQAQQEEIAKYEAKVLGTLNDNEDLYLKVGDNTCQGGKFHQFQPWMSAFDGSLMFRCIRCALEFILKTPD